MDGYNVTEIGSWAFQRCKGITQIELPDSVTKIGDNAFVGCNKLTTVVLSNQLLSIGGGAFSECSNLKNINLPEGLLSISGGAFTEDVILELDGYTITKILDGVFGNSQTLDSVVIPEGVTEIGLFVFSECTTLTEIQLPSTLVSIGSYAFQSCFILEEIRFQGSLAEWNAVEKEDGWRGMLNETCKIICNDKTVDLNGNEVVTDDGNYGDFHPIG